MNPNKAHIRIHLGRQIYYLCCPMCQAEFEKDPQKYTAKNRKKRK
ncbi:MAG: TRASH domain-containing protein [bacterium]